MKRVIKFLISIIYYIFILYIYTSLINRFKKNKFDNFVILVYHSIPRNKIKSFIKQLDYIIKVTMPIHLDYEKVLNKNIRYSVVTFDDGFQSVIVNGVPELLKRKIPFTIFIPSGQIGKKPEWLGNTDDEDKNESIASVVDLLNLPKELTSFGSHTINHPKITTLNKEQAYKEIKTSKDQLESLFKKEIKYFAFPHGDYNQQTLNLCKKAGYRKVFTINYISPDNHFNGFELGRVSVDSSNWMIEFKLKVLGAYGWMYYASLIKRKLKCLLSSQMR
jgi:peptidoglycan/xylan/chitin deacetylase (PgdA/CDA1 family)